MSKVRIRYKIKVSYKNSGLILDFIEIIFHIIFQNFCDMQKKREERRVVDYEIHPEFVRATLTHDMCVMKLAEPLQFSRTIRPICLSTTPVRRNEPVYVAGW